MIRAILEGIIKKNFAWVGNDEEIDLVNGCIVPLIEDLVYHGLMVNRDLETYLFTCQEVGEGELLKDSSGRFFHSHLQVVYAAGVPRKKGAVKVLRILLYRGLTFWETIERFLHEVGRTLYFIIFEDQKDNESVLGEPLAGIPVPEGYFGETDENNVPMRDIFAAKFATLVKELKPWE